VLRFKAHSQLSVDDPFQILLAFIKSTGTCMHSSEQLWVPVYTLTVAFCRLFTLSFLDLGLCVGGYILVLSLHSFSHIVPQFLRFSLVLLL
jgi:hypothetical protein